MRLARNRKEHFRALYVHMVRSGNNVLAQCGNSVDEAFAEVIVQDWSEDFGQRGLTKAVNADDVHVTQ